MENNDLTIQDMMNIIEEKYNVVELRDCNTNEVVSMFYLNKKHSIEDFQDAIYKAKNNHEEEIYEYGDDWSFIQEDLDDFDYYEVGFDDADYWVEY